ncbi:hypothetical protein GBA52_024383, partial [Prunus armeniaca]
MPETFQWPNLQQSPIMNSSSQIRPSQWRQLSRVPRLVQNLQSQLKLQRFGHTSLNN